MIDWFRTVCGAAVKQFAVRAAATDSVAGSRGFRKSKFEADGGRLLFEPDYLATAVAFLAEPL
mgnify:CR=1 FL=1